MAAVAHRLFHSADSGDVTFRRDAMISMRGADSYESRPSSPRGTWSLRTRTPNNP